MAKNKPGMTLIELLVVITILTTLVAGVIPILSPNNDVRKIREASRGLQAFITSAQSEAARLGRPHGVFFKKLSTDTGDPLDRGACLEVFHVSSPSPFAGFSDSSRVRLGRSQGSGGPVTRVEFVVIDGITNNPPPADPMPPNLLRRGDLVEVDGARYRIIDEDRDGDGNSDHDPSNPATHFRPGDYYTLRSDQKHQFQCVPVLTPPPPLVNFVNTSDGFEWSNPEHYRVVRQPTLSDESPYQLPRGICVDLQASGLPVSSQVVQIPTCCHNPLTTLTDVDQTSPGLTNNDDGITIMFAPDGTVSSYLWNAANEKNPDPDAQTATAVDVNPTGQLAFLIGRRENVPTPIRQAADWELLNASNDAVSDLREQVNWLNPDSRWIAIGTQTGRVITAENNVIDIQNVPEFSPSFYSGNQLANLMQAIPAQLREARAFAREMRQLGSN